MRLSRKGAIFIGRFEGFVPIPYDVFGIAHIGFGHKLHDGPVTDRDVREWGTITKKRGLELLQTDAQVKADAIDELVHVRLRNQAQIDALISPTFNLGTGWFAESEIPYLLNHGMPQAARRELLKYDHAEVNGIMTRIPGLTRRRRAEARLFRTGNYFLARL